MNGGCSGQDRRLGDRLGEVGRAVLLGLCLVLLVAAAHRGALNGGFRYDDHQVIVENPALRSWEPLRFFTEPFLDPSTGGGGFRPLTLMSFAANHAAFGDGPLSYLAVNLGLYACLTLMVFVVGSRLLGHVGWGAVAGAIFAVHPVNAEAVNYISARFSLLSGFWTMVALWACIKAAESRRGPWTATGLVALSLALLSKESALAFVVPLAAYAFVPRSGSATDAGRGAFRSRVLAAIPWGVVAIAYLLLWFRVVGPVSAESQAARYPIWAFAEIVWRSLGLWVWPWPLGPVHAVTFVDRADMVLGAILTAASAACLTLIVVWWRRDRLAAWLIIWVLSSFVMLAPLPWITTKALLMENRILMGAAGLAWLAARGLQLVSDRFPARPIWRPVALAAGSALLLAAVMLDQSRSAVWSDERRLWAEVVERAPDNAAAYVELGRAFRDRGELDKAEAVLRRAVERLPGYPPGYWNLGAVYALAGRYDEARLAVTDGIARDPGFWKGHHLLGEIEFKSGRIQEATAAYELAVALNPCDVEAVMRLGAIANQRQDPAEAARRYQAAVACDPGNREALNSLAGLAINRRDWDQALAYANAALRAAPGALEAEYHRAVALAGLRRGDEARDALQRVLARMPDEPRFVAYRQAVKDLLAGIGP